MSRDKSAANLIRTREWVERYHENNPDARRWAAGYGAINHTIETQARVFQMADYLRMHGLGGDGVPIFDLLYALDRITSASMWIVVHETYAQNVYLDGRDLQPADFKPDPQGHTGGALNMVPAYLGYMAINALTGTTRSWIMGQGHTVAAIDTANLVLDNMLPEHAERYSLTDEGLTRYVRDFYSYRLRDDGQQDSPLGSHVNSNTAGGLAEGGYLGFTELQYVHLPLPGESLTVFLSDGAFEEQRGSDWAPRWWRGSDSGLVTPIMIHNGRRIDQRTTLSQQGGTDWLVRHQRLNSFDPIVFDGADPAAFAWAIFEMEERLKANHRAVVAGAEKFPVRLPYGIAVAPKGAGFYGEGTNLAHNLPLDANPAKEVESAGQFNRSARRLWVSSDELHQARERFFHHDRSGRPKEREHPMAVREVELREIPSIRFHEMPEDRRDSSSWPRTSPMYAVDEMFLAYVRANPHLRPRVGNPDEMKSNKMQHTLDALKFRVTDPEAGIPESIDGAVVTALNEEAVASAALGNKGGINIIVTYEAFGAKMHGEVRQEIIFAQNGIEAGRPPKWLSIPLVLTSHAWENGKNEQSHQDPAMAETMLNETSHVSRVVFPPDYNTAVAVMQAVYQTKGQIWTLVVPKATDVPELFSEEEARRLLADGAMRLDWASNRVDEAELVLTAIGAYQLGEVLRAAERLRERDVPHSVIYMIEPGRFRTPVGPEEGEHAASQQVIDDLYPDRSAARVFVTHTRPWPVLGALGRLNTGARTSGLGFINQGGTLDVDGLMFINRTSWAHVVAEGARVLNRDANEFLTEDEIAALSGRKNPEGVIVQAR